MRNKKLRASGGKVLERFASRLPLLALSQPFEFMIATASVVAGVLAVLDLARSASIVALPQLLAIIWGIELLVGGTLLLYGLVKQKPRIELAGLQLYGTASLAYAVAIGMFIGTAGIGSVVFYICIAVACGLRAFSLMVIEKALKVARTVTE